ncbi:UNVERIFIED_CONTAM: Retrovirus-related Pol polyprotein from transposon RE1 [Sesamum indicum]
MDPRPDINRAYSMVLNVEKQREVNFGQQQTAPNMAMQTFRKQDNSRNFQKRRNPMDKKALICKHCGKSGHQKEGCFDIIRYPEWYKPFQEQKKANQGNNNRFAGAINTEDERANNTVDERAMSNLIRSEFHKLFDELKSQGSGNTHTDKFEFSGKNLEHNLLSMKNTNCWIVDSGATSHMCNNFSLFDYVKPHAESTYIHLADGSRHLIKNSGNVKLTKNLLLENTLHVPDLKFNLLSVSKLCSCSSVSFEFSESHCILQDRKTKQIIGIACQIGNLYVIKTESFEKGFIEDVISNFRNSGFIATKLDTEIWHRRLGHVSHDVLINTGLIHKNADRYSSCDICPQAKQHRLPFTVSSSYSPSIFDLIHVDLWGPYNEYSLSNCMYMLTIVDDHSRCTWTFLMQQKSQTFSLLKDFHRMICTQFDKKIKKIRTDNGLEFLSEQCQNFFKQEGIIHQTTCTYTPSLVSELKALEDNATWDITKLPENKRAIGSKWVYKLKLKPDGSLDRCKARLVAKGYNQIEGIDYNDSFSPVAKAVTIRTFLAVICKQHWFLHQLDINNAFLHGFIEEEIYMKPPEGYDVPAGHVCKLKKSLYGLKQASRQWNLEFTKQLEKIGFTQSKSDHCLFTVHTDTGFFCLLVYVDDVLIAGPCEHTIAEFKIKLHNLFTIKNLGKARFFLGLEIGRSNEGMIVTQSKYVKDIIADAGLSQCKATNTPLPAGLQLTAASG